MEPFSIDGLTVRPILGTGFGAEIEGVDWTRVPLSEKDIQNLVSLQNRFGVLIFRNTGLDNDRHVKFAAQLGELEMNPT
ncbi:uncharacterized protein TRUGW13939_00021 [Talaromyces rugulosus]|uniref:TauD/TfdA-like domain-containing protein n=1 Tax=Talaromyces rugulosus TaxID=121627 RepID=A0A7H8QG67_TALRU|nr:uncharacterized protein TRUGW13939_00021 [Talaromyces rugulosus]QKX52950.1 hypothetical protein TRUGW13939_00021 [Talaromyces rugulosus]